MPAHASHSPIRRVLIANRGEIAVRVIRTCRELGIETIAVFSEVDRTALHVRLADHAFELGPAEASRSYLNIPAILAAAARAGADAIHPGYGFLSENADFAEACASAGIRFIGPPPAAIRAMGNKTEARSLMARANVPMAPGSPDAVEDVGEALSVADSVGFPVLIKAAAGGGGKGMRQVHRREELPAAFQMATSEALNAFGDGRVYVEKYLVDPRHIEIQVLADEHGQVVHLFERDCSIQRRHQKVIEEAPSPVLDNALRAEMGEAAIAAARSCGYVGAGTVEFLVDRDRNFYFMEMNTRIQVEHPVTEMITGIDLVAEQIAIAEGRPLRFSQREVWANGHAIECRIYAEDPQANFIPSPGHVLRHKAPSGPGIRLDAGVAAGDAVHVHYDPMMAKLIAWGTDRDQAVRRMRRALAEYEVAGVRTTIPFCRFVMEDEAFLVGNATTHFVADRYRPGSWPDAPDDALQAAAVAAALFEEAARSRKGAAAHDPGVGEWSPWSIRRRWI